VIRWGIFLAFVLTPELGWTGVSKRHLNFRICQWETKLERLPVSCLFLGKSLQGRCSPYHLRRTPTKRLAKAQTLKKLDSTCRQAVKEEIARRKYLSNPLVNILPHPAKTHQFFDTIPEHWQEN